jgi:hypothetical protein
MAYDSLVRHNPNTANKKYLEILSLSAKESEAGVEDALYHLLDDNNLISTEAVKAILEAKAPVSISTDVAIDEIDLSIYDAFLSLERV